MAKQTWQNRIRYGIRLLLCMACIFLLTCCGQTGAAADTGNTNDKNVADSAASDTDGSGEKLTVVTTLFPQYDFARQIAGDHADVTLVLKPGTESHMYDPTPGDMITISNADIFIYTGAEMEPWAQELADSVDMSSVRIVDASENIELMLEADHDDEDGDEAHDHNEAENSHVGHNHTYDPHIWLDMENAMQMVRTITEAFCEADPENADEYLANAAVYLEELQALDEELEEIVADGNRSDIVFGGRFAYGYFISAYGLEYESVYDSCSAETEPSMAQMAAVIDYMTEHDVHYILYEELSTPNVARAIAEATDAEMLLFSTCHNVTKDEFEAGVTFIDLMQQNAETLRTVLE